DALPGRGPVPLLRRAAGRQPYLQPDARRAQSRQSRGPPGTFGRGPCARRPGGAGHDPVGPTRVGVPMQKDRPDLRLIVITDRRLASPRSIFDVVLAALEAGAPAVQLRDKEATSRELYEQALRLREMTDRHGALLFVNDRLDVALAAGAGGVHLRPDDLPIAAARRIAPPHFLIGASTDDPAAAIRAADNGADYIGCGSVFGTTTKAEAAGERIGPEGVAAVARASPVPVIAIG